MRGVTVLAAALLVFLLGTQGTGDESTGRAMAFITLVVVNLGLVLSNKMLDGQALAALRRLNRALAIVFTVAVAGLILALAVPELRHLFSFSPLPAGKVAAAVLAGLLTLAVNVAAIQLRHGLSRP